MLAQETVRFRAYIVKESPSDDAAIAFLAKRLADYGHLTHHEIKPYWKIPELDESTWISSDGGDETYSSYGVRCVK